MAGGMEACGSSDARAEALKFDTPMARALPEYASASTSLYAATLSSNLSQGQWRSIRSTYVMSRTWKSCAAALVTFQYASHLSVILPMKAFPGQQGTLLVTKNSERGMPLSRMAWPMAHCAASP